MGRTYYAKSKTAKGNYGSNNYDENFSGCDILGCLMKAVDEHNKRVEEDYAKYNLTDRLPCTLFKATEEECVRAATKLRALTDEQLSVVLEQCGHCFQSPTLVELKTMMMGWAEFLETCGGYEVPS